MLSLFFILIVDVTKVKKAKKLQRLETLVDLGSSRRKQPRPKFTALRELKTCDFPISESIWAQHVEFMKNLNIPPLSLTPVHESLTFF